MPRPISPLLRCCVAAALVAVTCLANAQSANPRAEEALQKLKAADANGDGMLSREEVKDMPRLSKASTGSTRTGMDWSRRRNCGLPGRSCGGGTRTEN